MESISEGVVGVICLSLKESCLDAPMFESNGCAILAKYSLKALSMERASEVVSFPLSMMVEVWLFSR